MAGRPACLDWLAGGSDQHTRGGTRSRVDAVRDQSIRSNYACDDYYLAGRDRGARVSAPCLSSSEDQSDRGASRRVDFRRARPDTCDEAEFSLAWPSAFRYNSVRLPEEQGDWALRPVFSGAQSSFPFFERQAGRRIRTDDLLITNCFVGVISEAPKRTDAYSVHLNLVLGVDHRV